jgi:hypothetical protein
MQEQHWSLPMMPVMLQAWRGREKGVGALACLETVGILLEDAGTQSLSAREKIHQKFRRTWHA